MKTARWWLGSALVAVAVLTCSSPPQPGGGGGLCATDDDDCVTQHLSVNGDVDFGGNGSRTPGGSDSAQLVVDDPTNDSSDSPFPTINSLTPPAFAVEDMGASLTIDWSDPTGAKPGFTVGLHACGVKCGFLPPRLPLKQHYHQTACVKDGAVAGKTILDFVTHGLPAGQYQLVVYPRSCGNHVGPPVATGPITVKPPANSSTGSGFTTVGSGTSGSSVTSGATTGTGPGGCNCCVYGCCTNPSPGQDPCLNGKPYKCQQVSGCAACSQFLQQIIASNPCGPGGSVYNTHYDCSGGCP